MVEEGFYVLGRCANGWPKVGLELLVLASLRLLGSGCIFDLVEDFMNVSVCTIRDFFQKKFCQWGKRLSKRLIKFPEKEAEMRRIVGLYERIGWVAWVRRLGRLCSFGVG